MAVYFISETAKPGDVQRAVESGLLLTIINVQTPQYSFLVGRNPNAEGFAVWQLTIAENRILLGVYGDWAIAVQDAFAAENKYKLFRRGPTNA